MSIKLKKEILNNFYAILGLSIFGLLHPFISEWIPAFPNTSYDFKLAMAGAFAFWPAVIMICTKTMDGEGPHFKVHKKRILAFRFAIVAVAIWGMKWEIDYPLYPELDPMPTFLGVGTDVLGYTSYWGILFFCLLGIAYIRKIPPVEAPRNDMATGILGSTSEQHTSQDIQTHHTEE